MYSNKLLQRILSQFSISVGGGKCGIDDEELKHVSSQLKEVDCGMNAEDLKKCAQQFDDLPIEKKIEIAEKFIDMKLYEEDILNRYGITRASMYRWQAKGKLPPFRHEGGKKNYLFTLEADEAVRRWDATHSE